MGLCSCPLFIFTSTLSFPLSLFRFCTAAADRKLRLLTSDLQNKHEVKVANTWSEVCCLVGIKFSLAYTDICYLATLQIVEQRLIK